MIHTKRLYHFDFDENDALVERTVDEVYDYFERFSALVLCTAFCVNGHLWVNDSFNEDGLQEYAVIRVDAITDKEIIGTQINSVTVTWAIQKKNLRIYLAAPSGEMNEPVRLKRGHGKRCPLCA